MQLREYLRVAFECPAEFSGEQLLGEGTVMNLSLGGFAVESAQPVKTGTTLRLRLFLPDDEKPILIEQAVVRWVKQGKFGVKTIRIGKDDGQRLNRFIVQSVNKVSRPVPEPASQSDD